jgi:FKBP-type peptidyl-prolyl cis-trans isomerase
MLSMWTIRLLILAAGFALAAGMAAAADPDRLKMPDLKNPGWKEMPNGMRYWDSKAGVGDTVQKGDTLKLHYTGWLTSGKIFDSSVQRGQPITFGLNQLIKGWQEGVPGMKTGGIRYLEIPYQLAYGERGTPDGTIPARATLIFEIEVLERK